MIILTERNILTFLRVGFNYGTTLSDLSVSSAFYRVFFVCVTEIRNELNALFFVLLDSAVNFIHIKPEGFKANTWLELPSFSFFFMFPWLSATVSYEFLYWIKSADI